MYSFFLRIFKSVFYVWKFIISYLYNKLWIFIQNIHLNKKYVSFLSNLLFFKIINTTTRKHHKWSRLEFYWTFLPALTLIVLAIPTMIFLYTVDVYSGAAFILRVTGHQWYWSYEYDYWHVSFIAFLKNYAFLKENSYIFKNFFILFNILDDFNPYSCIQEDGIYLPKCITLKLYWFFEVEQILKPTNLLKKGEIRLLEVFETIIIPVNQTTKVILTSADVLHSWTLPGFGVKMDAVPGRLNVCYLHPKVPGYYYGQCSELCGVNHGFMPIKIVVGD